MGIIISLTLIICGCFASYQTIAAKKPEAAQLLDKIAPYKPWIGLFALVWGIIGTLNMLSIIAAIGLWWMIGMLSSLCLLVLGFLLSFELLQKHLLKGNENAEAKAAEMKAKLMAKQVIIGYVSIGLGILSLLLVFMY